MVNIQKPAAGYWFTPDYKTLLRGSYLIAANGTFDVAFYEGKRPDGAPWWIVGDVEIHAKAITLVAVINAPEAK